jgi:hypothetical protein
MPPYPKRFSPLSDHAHNQDPVWGALKKERTDRPVIIRKKMRFHKVIARNRMTSASGQA